MNIKIKKLDVHAVLPTYAKLGDAGMDLTAISVNYSEDQLYIEYSTGWAIEIPFGYVGLLFPRSSVSKVDLILANCVGVIDSGYRGEIKCRFKHIRFDGPYYIYKVGERIAQLVIMPIPLVVLEETKELSESERGEGGFGHTTK
jgi:dUTP pyrophosphatase